MNSQSKHGTQIDLAQRDLAEYGVARFRDQIFDAVLALWQRRKSEGWTQKRIADTIGRDPAWVSRNLRAPGNWTCRIAGELIQGLNGEAEVRIDALEDAATPRNYNAYQGYLAGPEVVLVHNSTWSQIVMRPSGNYAAVIETNR